MLAEKVYSRTEPKCGICNRPFQLGDEVVQVIKGKYTTLPYVMENGQYDCGIEDGEILEYHVECKPTNIRLVKGN